MDERVNNISLIFKCDADWSTMTDVADGRYCDSCQKVVYDFTDAKQSEFLKALTRVSDYIYGRVINQQLKPQKVGTLQRKKMLLTAMVLIATNIFNISAAAQGKEDAAKKNDTIMNGIGFGRAQNDPPVFPGGEDALMAFLSKNVQYQGKTGKVFIQFDIDTLGSVINIRVTRGLDGPSNLEAIRVLKLMPKWKPSAFQGKPLISTYIMPIAFKNK